MHLLYDQPNNTFVLKLFIKISLESVCFNLRLNKFLLWLTSIASTALLLGSNEDKEETAGL